MGGERQRVRERERERGGGRISSGEDAHWECVADQRAESETSRCTADDRASELADTPECERRGADYREQREGEESKALAGGGGSDSPIPPLPITVWTPDAGRVSFAIVLRARHQSTRITPAPSPHG